MVGERPGQLGKLELDLRKGVLVLAVLSQLRTQQYGYSLRQALGDRGMPIDEGTLHPLPRRLEAQGLLASEWRIDEGPPRRYYRLSDHGTEVYRELTAAWRSLTSVMDHLLTRRVEMYTKGIIETYVDDVVWHVPRRQRNDVGLELRSLLEEELQGRAADAGRPVDEAMTVDMLTAFGHPQDVADRYRPTGFTVIRPADAPRFAWVALSGVALQWAVTLPQPSSGPRRSASGPTGPRHGGAVSRSGGSRGVWARSGGPAC